MALSTNQITAITERFFVPKLVDNVYGSNAWLARLRRDGYAETFDGGHQIYAPVVSSKPSSGGYFSDYEAISTSPTDNITSAAFDIKQIHEPIKMSRMEELKNAGKAAKLKLLASKMMIAEMNIKENLALGLFSDGTAATGALTTKQLTGIRAILSTSTTLGGIAVADMADWVAVVEDNSGTNRALSLNLMQKVDGATAYDNKKTTVIIARQNIVDVYWGLAQPFQRLASDEMKKLGFDNVPTFNSKPVLVDSHHKANAMSFINEDFVKLYVHSAEDMRFQKVDQIEGQAATLGRIFWAGNLVCNGRRYNGELSDLITS